MHDYYIMSPGQPRREIVEGSFFGMIIFSYIQTTARMHDAHLPSSLPYSVSVLFRRTSILLRQRFYLYLVT